MAPDCDTTVVGSVDSAAISKLVFVDLDGTLISSDLLWESLALLIRGRPLYVFRLPLWLLAGRANLKTRLAGLVDPDVGQLPFRPAVVDFLNQLRERGCVLVLATASHARLADQVATHLGLFHDVLSTDDTQNLKGPAKLARILEYCRARGETAFAYIGDAQADLPIWRAAQEAFVVAPTGAVRRAVSKTLEPAQVLVPSRPIWRPILRALRPEQWVKNLLLFVPLILAHKLNDLAAIGKSIVAFAAFSACASAVYLLNDAMDVEADRRHPVKRRRPFAAGDLTLRTGMVICAALLLFGFGVSLGLLPLEFAGVLAIYLFANLGYSGGLKRKFVIDVLLLAGMYALRILGGAVATDVLVSEWLLAFSGFFFLSLAFVKRYAELTRLAGGSEQVAEGRGYLASDLYLVESMGTCSGYLAVLVLALYMHSSEVQALYLHREPLWLVCGLLLYWISRLWFWAKRGELLEDPILFTLKDRTSLIVGALIGILLLAAWGGK